MHPFLNERNSQFMPFLDAEFINFFLAQMLDPKLNWLRQYQTQDSAVNIFRHTFRVPCSEIPVLSSVDLVSKKLLQEKQKLQCKVRSAGGESCVKVNLKIAKEQTGLDDGEGKRIF